MGEVSISPVKADDRQMILEWRNTPFLVNLGSSGRKVTWEEHRKWFDNILRDSDTALYIIFSGTDPAGQIRFERENEKTYIVTIYLLKQYTGKGMGVTSLKKGVEVMLKEDPKRRFIAFIKEDNKISIAAFFRAGFKITEDHDDLPSGHVAMYYEQGVED